MSSSEDSDSDSDYEEVQQDAQQTERSDTIVENEQWVRFIEFYSGKQSADVNYNSQQAIVRGSSVEKLCARTDADFSKDDKVESGLILVNNNRQECLVVSFETPVFINEIHIYESLNPGSIVKLEILEPQRNNWWTTWQRKSAPEKATSISNIFKPILRRYRFQSNTLRITLDPSHADRVAIHAIKLLGTNVFDVSLHQNTLSQAMTKLHEQITSNPSTSDVHFQIDTRIVHAHRNILCCRSSYFRALLLGDFAEKNQQHPIVLNDIDYKTFAEIIFFIYTSTYHHMSFDMAMKCMLYADRINLITAKNAALEQVCRHLRLDHSHIIPVFRVAKQMSPSLDILLDYVYELCSQCMLDICNQTEFQQLEKDLMIEIIRKCAEKREAKNQQRLHDLGVRDRNVSNQDDELGGGGGG